MKIWGKEFGSKAKGKAGKKYLTIAQSNVEKAKRKSAEEAKQRKNPPLEEQVSSTIIAEEPAQVSFDSKDDEIGSGYLSAEDKARQLREAMQKIKRNYEKGELLAEGYRLLKGTQKDGRQAWFAILKDNHDYLIFRQTNKHELDDSSFEFRYKGDGKKLKPGLKELVKKYEEKGKK